MLRILLLAVFAVSVAYADPVPLRGTLSRHCSRFLLDGRIPLRFATATPVNGTHFDGRSEEFFLGKEVSILATPPAEGSGGEYLVTAITEVEPLRISAEPAQSEHHWRIEEEGFGFIRGALFANKNTQVETPFTETIYSKEGYMPRAGEEALIITLSGRQGDDATAAGGHFATGSGVVRQDGRGLWLDGELFNIYVRNEKGVVPGVTPWQEYFGGITSGQSNYRPTWTLVLYGVQPEKLRRLRESLETHYPLFRSGQVELSLNYNCTTVSVQALAGIGVYGVQRRGVNGSRAFPLLPSQPEVPRPVTGGPASLLYLATHDRREVFPRNAWVSILGNLRWLQGHAGLDLSRVDLVFQPQVPSARYIGGAPANDIGDAIRSYFTPHRSPEELFNALNEID